MATLADTKVRELMKTARGRRYLKSLSTKTPLKRNRTETVSETVPFVFWDGEGTSGRKGNRPAYVLFGSSEGHEIKGRRLSGRDCLDLLLQGKRDYPDSYHVVFAGSYDVNMILFHCVEDDDMPREAVDLLREGHAFTWCPEGSSGTSYTLKYVPKKIFTISDGKTTMELFDSFTFFGSKFTKALEDYLGKGSVPQEVIDGKDKRNDFTYRDIKEIRKYWQIEGDLGRQLMEALQERLHKVDIDVSAWYGPGAVARSVLKKNKIKDAMCRDLPEKVREASQYAYFGGRFERFRIGRSNHEVFGADVNSAYPYALTLVPNLATATWRHTKRVNVDKLKNFSLYKVKYEGYGRNLTDVAPHPLPWRSQEGFIAFPYEAQGWYWGCEVRAARDYVKAHGGTLEITEGWICTDDGTRPFDFIQEMYDERQRLKALGLPEQLALKLALNSIYGKLAQQIGAKFVRGQWTIPEFHQLEWAGFATAMCRSMILRAATKAPEDVVAIETDGIYTLKDLGYKDSKKLGGWETTHYDDVIYLDSGIYWGLKGKKWEIARFRGVGGVKTTEKDAINFLKQMPNKIGDEQPGLSTTVTMFHAMGDHLEDGTWCHWVPETRVVSPWRAEGKRYHHQAACRACKRSKKPSAVMHDTVTPSGVGDSISSKHKLLWVDGEIWFGEDYHIALDNIEDEADEW